MISLSIIKTDKPANTMVRSPIFNEMIVGMQDGSVRVYGIINGMRLRTLPPHSSPVFSIALRQPSALGW